MCVKSEVKGSEVIISVKDSGSGIDHQIMPRLFTKFASKASSGETGLGLFISKSIVKADGGRVWAQNNADGRGGTTIIIVVTNLVSNMFSSLCIVIVVH
jgi:signal transduction histidine kinase